MKFKNFLLALSACLLTVVCVDRVVACSCVGGFPPCQVYGSTDAVFTGTVMDLKRQTVKRDMGGSEYEIGERVFVLQVDEAFRGVTEKEVQVVTGQGGGDCGYDFKIGERYLVYAGRNKKDGTLFTGICSRTRPVANAEEDLTYIRSLDKRKPGGMIYGAINRNRRNLETEQYESLGALSGIEILIEGASKTYKARTDADGRYKIAGLPAGDYKVKPLLPKNLDNYDMTQQIRLNERGCSVVGFLVTDNGRISGRVIDVEGNPVARMMLDLIPYSHAEKEKPNTTFVSANEEGYYEFKFIPPGTYLLGIRLDGLGSPDDPEASFPRTYYPGVATAQESAVLTIDENQVLTDINIKLLPKLKPRVIEGIVVYPDGRPAANAGISYRDMSYASPHLSYAVWSDKDGRFRIQAYDGLPYALKAVVSVGNTGRQMHAEPIEVAATGNVSGIKLVITREMGNCQRCYAIMNKRVAPQFQK